MLDFFTKIKSYLPIILFIFIICSIFIFKFCLNTVEKERDDAVLKATELEASLTKQNDAINKLKETYEQQLKKAQQADKLANDKKAFYDNAAKEILNTQIDSTCNGAIKWGAIQGPVLSAQWLAD